MSGEKGKRVLIIGGGFAGLAAARELSGKGLEITLADKENHHLFQPLLYQVATAGLAAPSVAAPLRNIARKMKDVRVIQAKAESIDSEAKTVSFEGGLTLGYDALLLCAGSTNSYFGNDAWEQTAPGLKTLSDGMKIRAKILSSFERAELAQTEQEREELLTFAIIGGGPTGVELAGSLAEIARKTLPGEFRSIDPSSAKIVLLDGAPRPLMAFPEDLSAEAGAALDRLGVTRLHGARVTGIEEGKVSFDRDGEKQTLKAGVILWAAGVMAQPLGKALAARCGAQTDRSGRLMVKADLSVPGAEGVFAAGDAVALKIDDKEVPGVAPAAKQMGRQAARNMLALFAGEPTESFAYKNYGSLATIGRHEAVVWMERLRFGGYPAWLFWLFAHIFFLIGWRNRLVVMADWAWNYWTGSRWARIISSSEGKPKAKVEAETAGKPAG